ncbi:MAG: type II toxin-antitoxin system HicB family antitoxin [Deltaproteobacteria bacterium]|nr:type II toxin-antitoxin system HicB family antitoxin [Deltaproteobacteria bacterium]
MIQYKGYMGKVEFDDVADIFHGEVIGLRDVITFQGRTVEEVKGAFRESVDDYLAFCAKRGEEPEKPFTGKFVVRIPPDLHRKVYVAAKKSGSSLNSWILQTLEHSTEHVT